MNALITLRVPATSANLGSGFDTIGMAVSLYNIFKVTELLPEGEYKVEALGEGARELSSPKANLVVKAYEETCERWNVKGPGFALWCHNIIPLCRGLGSSAGAVVAGVLIAKYLTGYDADDDELLRATFTEDGREGEGMFAATVVDFGPVQIAAGAPSGYQIPSADGGYYMAYNIMAVTAAKDTLIEWEDVLTQCMGTLEYSQAYVQSVQQAGQEQVAQAMQFSANGNAVLDGIMSSWEARSTSQDIISQKQSDATLGYERVYDTQTGEIYRAENGWSDTYQGGRYEPVTDDSMYTEPISGYIE